MGPIFNGANVDGGTFPAQIWGEYMKMAARGYCGEFKKPDHPFKPKTLKGRYSREAPVAPTPTLTPEQLAAQAKQAREQVQRNAGAIKPGSGTTPQPATGGNGYNPDAYNPDLYETKPTKPKDPNAGANEPQATPTPPGGAATPP
jgi:penicillin-binding protein 1A